MSEVKDDVMTPEVEGQEPETVTPMANTAVAATTGELQDEVSDGVAAVLPMVEVDEEEAEREPAPAMAEAA